MSGALAYRMVLRGLLVVAMVFAVSGCAGNIGGGALQGDEGGEFPSDDITMIIPVSPGGGFDTTTRLLIPYWEEYLPGDANIVPENRSGGEWKVGIDTLMRAEPDGYTMSVFNIPGNVIGPITGQADYDLTSVEWLGQYGQESYIAAVSNESGFSSLEELQQQERVNAGLVGLNSTGGVTSVIAADALGIKIEPITHEGSNEAVLSAVRGDVDYVQYPYSTIGEFIESGELMPLWVYADERLEELPDVPTIGELGYSELVEVVTLSRLMGTTPGTPEDRVQILSDAFEQAVKDPDFQKEMQEQDIDPVYLSPEEASEVVSQAIEQMEPYADVITAQQ